MDAGAATETARGSSPTRSAQEVLRRMSLNSPPSRTDNPRQVKRAKVSTPAESACCPPRRWSLRLTCGTSCWVGSDFCTVARVKKRICLAHMFTFSAHFVGKSPSPRFGRWCIYSSWGVARFNIHRDAQPPSNPAPAFGDHELQGK